MSWADRAERAVQATLHGAQRARTADGPKRTMTFSVAGADLVVQWLPVGWPREVDEAARADPRPDIVIAPAMSPGARRVAEKAGMGWIDETGAANIYIADPHIDVARDGSPRLPLDTKVGWRRSTLGVCEAILADQVAPTVSSVVAATEMSWGSVAQALKFLDESGHLEKTADRGPDAARRIVDRDTLLDAYATAASRLRYPTLIEVGVLWRDPIDALRQVGELWESARVKWAATGAISAAVLAPFMTEIAPMEIYVTGRTPADLHRVAQVAGLAAMSGGRLILRPFPTPAGGRLSYEVTPGVRSVLWPRAFADLRIAGVRGDDAAEHLREEMTR
jgi:hypothetical protein